MTEMEFDITLLELHILANGLWVKNMEKELPNIALGHLILENGKMIFMMEKDLKNMLMELSIVVSGNKAKNTGMDVMLVLLDKFFREIGLMITFVIEGN